MITDPFRLPASRAAIAADGSRLKRDAFLRARQSPWYRDRLAGIDPDRLDDPAVWQRIPILTKEELRQLSHDEFMAAFCIVDKGEIAEFWRSGGSTGRPVYYPRTFSDLDWGLLSWSRSFGCIGIGPGDLCHMTFPLGVHPAGNVWARTARELGIGLTWAGGGNSTPSEAQLDLIANLRPTVLMGMSSFLLHLGNLAEARGIDTRASTVKKIITSAEMLSDAKRRRLERMWDAEVFDVFGMSEAGLMGAENAVHDGIHIWTDLYHVEVVDEGGSPVPEGEVGTFCVTPLHTTTGAPFLRWNSGDLVRYVPQSKGTGRWADLFPMIRHAARTTGFFKVRGVNVNHADFEDTMFRLDGVSDFQCILFTESDGARENLRVKVEVSRGHDEATVLATVRDTVKRVFEISAAVEHSPLGTLATEFAKSLKAPRFIDQRE